MQGSGQPGQTKGKNKAVKNAASAIYLAKPNAIGDESEGSRSVRSLNMRKAITPRRCSPRQSRSRHASTRAVPRKPSFEKIPHGGKPASDETASARDPDELVASSSNRSEEDEKPPSIRDNAVRRSTNCHRKLELALIREQSSMSHKSAPESPTKKIMDANPDDLPPLDESVRSERHQRR